MMEKISIIVSIYNSEKYLEQCVESLVRQTYPNIEIVLVNDGSTDRSAQICQNFGLQNKNIKYVSVENSGCVKARKIGMQNAVGNIIAFVDSDDWIESNAIESMYQKLMESNADMIVTGYYENVNDEERIIVNAIEDGVYRGFDLEQKIYSQMLCKEDYFSFGIMPFLWGKLYRRDVIEKYILETDDRITIGEDVVCVYPALLASTCVCVVDGAYYHYRIHGSSMMHSNRDILREYENIQLQEWYLKNIFEKHPKKDVLLCQLDRYITHHQMVRCLSLFNKMSNRGLCFPFQNMEEGSNIIIYGAGAFGIAAYQFFSSLKEYNVVGWCDRDYIKYQNLKYHVEDIDTVLEADYDYIVIAIMNERTAMTIKKKLREMDVSCEKMIWIEDIG